MYCSTLDNEPNCVLSLTKYSTVSKRVGRLLLFFKFIFYIEKAVKLYFRGLICEQCSANLAQNGTLQMEKEKDVHAWYYKRLNPFLLVVQWLSKTLTDTWWWHKSKKRLDKESKQHFRSFIMELMHFAKLPNAFITDVGLFGASCCDHPTRTAFRGNATAVFILHSHD